MMLRNPLWIHDRDVDSTATLEVATGGNLGVCFFADMGGASVAVSADPADVARLHERFGEWLSMHHPDLLAE